MTARGRLAAAAGGQAASWRRWVARHGSCCLPARRSRWIRACYMRMQLHVLIQVLNESKRRLCLAGGAQPMLAEGPHVAMDLLPRTL